LTFLGCEKGGRHLPFLAIDCESSVFLLLDLERVF
jgi:hypothetical protein